MHFEFSIVTISPLEPALLLSLVVASLATWFVGKWLGNVVGRIADPWRRVYLGVVWVLGTIAFFFLPHILVTFAYPALHPEDRKAMVCVAMVWPTFLVPTVIGIRAIVRGLRAATTAGVAPTVS